MKSTAFSILVLLTLTACGGESEVAPAPAAPQAAQQNPAEVFPTYDARTFFMTTSYSAVNPSGYAFTPGGDRILLSSDESGVFNARAFNLETGESGTFGFFHQRRVRGQLFSGG